MYLLSSYTKHKEKRIINRGLRNLVMELRLHDVAHEDGDEGADDDCSGQGIKRIPV
jgi:hypothetical protein